MLRAAAIALSLFTLVGCDGGANDDLVSTPLDDPTVEFDVLPPDVDPGWPLSGDTDT